MKPYHGLYVHCSLIIFMFLPDLRLFSTTNQYCAVLCLVAQSCPTLCDPMRVACQAPVSMGILQARIQEWVAMLSSRRPSKPRDQTQVSHIASRFFTSWATGKPMNPGMGSLSLLQGIFLTQELNGGFLHCRWVLNQLSYQGSPLISSTCEFWVPLVY